MRVRPVSAWCQALGAWCEVALEVTERAPLSSFGWGSANQAFERREIQRRD